jgi:ribosome recycling factor
MQYNFSTFKADLKKVEEFLGKEYRELNAGRASPAVLDSVSVESYGSFMPIKNIASVNIEDPKTLRVVPWDKNQVKDVERAIQAANLGLSIATDDAGIRVIFPQLTTETREKLVKVLKEKLEEARIVVRKERERVWEDIQKQERDGKMTEDERFAAKDALQKVIDEANKNLEATFEKKQTEVMG